MSLKVKTTVRFASMLDRVTPKAITVKPAPVAAPVPAKFQELYEAASDNMGYLLDVYFPIKDDSTPDAASFDLETAQPFCDKITALVDEAPSDVSSVPVTPAPVPAPAPKPAPVAAPVQPAPADTTQASPPRLQVRRRPSAPAAPPVNRKKKLWAVLTSPR